MTEALVARIALFGLLAIAATAQTQTLSIDEAVAIAMDKNRTVQSAALDVERAKEETAATKTTRLPQFQVYVLGGATLSPINFTIPRGALGVYPPRTRALRPQSSSRHSSSPRRRSRYLSSGKPTWP